MLIVLIFLFKSISSYCVQHQKMDPWSPMPVGFLTAGGPYVGMMTRLAEGLEPLAFLGIPYCWPCVFDPSRLAQGGNVVLVIHGPGGCQGRPTPSKSSTLLLCRAQVFRSRTSSSLVQVPRRISTVPRRSVPDGFPLA